MCRYLNFAIQFTPQYGDSFIGAAQPRGRSSVGRSLTGCFARAGPLTCAELLRLELLSEALRVLRRNTYDLVDRTTPRDDDEAVPLAEFLAGLDTSEVEQRCVIRVCVRRIPQRVHLSPAAA